MAAVVDSFEFLFRELARASSSFRDNLAILGALYTLRKSLSIAAGIARVLNDHAISALAGKYHNLGTKLGKWAVVTGSSEGIGKAYALELASRGMNIVLISKGQRQLNKTAKEIEEKYQVETCVVWVNFSSKREVFEIIRAAIADKEIGILVNNVGLMYDYPQYFLNVPMKKLFQIIDVNVTTATMMTHMILPQMIERNKGAVVMVSSGGTSRVTPQTTVYQATKCYLDYFLRSLKYEYKDSAVIFQSLRPFYVATRMLQYSESLSNPSLFIPTAAVYANHAVSTLGFASETTGYWPHTLQVHTRTLHIIAKGQPDCLSEKIHPHSLSWFLSLLPDWLFLWGVSRLNAAFRRRAEDRIENQSIRFSRDSSFDLSTIES